MGYALTEFARCSAGFYIGMVFWNGRIADISFAMLDTCLLWGLVRVQIWGNFHALDTRFVGLAFVILFDLADHTLTIMQSFSRLGSRS